MLKTRNLVVLAVVLVVLLAVKLLQDRGHEQATSQSGVTTIVPGPLDLDDLGSIVVGFGTDPEALVLERQPDGWAVVTAWNAAARRSRVEALVESLSGLQGEYRSDSPDVLADYGFTDSTTVSITVRDSDGDQVAEVEIGRKPQGAAGSFVKRPGESTVYLAAAPVLNRLGIFGQEPTAPNPRQFLDLEAYKVDRKEIASITLDDADGELVLQKEFPEMKAQPADTATAGDEATPAAEPEPDTSVWEWRLGGATGRPAVKTKADGVLGAVATLRAVDVADPGADPATYGLDAPTRRVVIELLDGSEVTLAFGGSREAGEDNLPAGTYLQVDDDPTVWVVSDYVAKNIFKSREDLLPDES
jgi:hypothetical protein